jgi:hypothetical protein
MCQTQLWAIVDSTPKDGVIVEWGAGNSSKFWLENTALSELWCIEHNDGWREIVEELCGHDPRFTLAFFPTKGLIGLNESVEFLADYSTARDVPVDRADVLIVDGFSRSTCIATAAMRAKKDAKLFLHDTDSKLYKWAIDHMNSHPDWREFGKWYPLPEDHLAMEMTGWQRIA